MKDSSKTTQALIEDLASLRRKIGNLEKSETERKKMEGTLRESEQRLNTLYRKSPIPTFTWQKRGDDFFLADYNPAADRITAGKVRDFLAKYDLEKTRQAPSPEALAQAQDYMYLAEGSDWFWWYGSDQDSGVDEYFDTGFRALLAKVYESLGEPVPTFVNVPIIPKKPEQPAQAFKGIETPVIDGEVGNCTGRL